MRKQETDQILKEARYARHAVAAQKPEPVGMWSRIRKTITGLPNRVMGMFRKPEHA